MNEPTTPDSVLNAIKLSETEIPDVLNKICARKRAETEKKIKLKSLKEIAEEARNIKAPTRGFARVLKEKMARGQMGLIAECKKASPSAGFLRQDYDPSIIAVQYENAGASCLSILTESEFFFGNNADLKLARDACSLPILRKDFIIDPWQVYESRVIEADCILLIMAALKDQEVVELSELASCLDLDVLVEVHDEQELNRALALDVSLIGINNRNLRTLKTDLVVTEELAPLVPPDRLIVSESGLKTFEDVNRVRKAGASAILVGESLLRQQNAGVAVRKLMGIEQSLDENNTNSSHFINE